ncbi:MAG: hypothetical protein HC915_04855 [Anaerolineae bacterium]|nr:hypothetical protein [Anaerolineae bacterium]
MRDYQPPLETVQNWALRALLIKVSPGVNLAEVAWLEAGVEFVSLGGELKEALLHLGELRFAGRRATLLPQGETLLPQGLEAPPLSPTPLRYLYEPDPAIIRAGLFGELLARPGPERLSAGPGNRLPDRRCAPPNALAARLGGARLAAL